MKLSDFTGLRNKATVRLVRKQRMSDDEYVFEFDGRGVAWRPGEHGIFSLPGYEVAGRKWRAFSIASIPEEGVLRIATKITGKSSSFKQHLKDLKNGDEVAVRGPFGWFYRKDDTTPMVMVAMGIGITPVMAVVNQHAYDPTAAPMHVIYAAHGDHLFRAMLDEAARKNPRIDISYVEGRQEAGEALRRRLAEYQGKAFYYLSGAPVAIKALTKKIKNAGVSGSRIITDLYLGY